MFVAAEQLLGWSRRGNVLLFKLPAYQAK